MSISQITSKINNLFSTIDKMITKVVPMPAILLLCACLNRKGLSPLRSLSNVCVALESLGIPLTNNPDGSTNLIVAVINEIFKEFYRAMTEDAVVQGAMQAGAIQIMSQGSNAAGTVTSMGTSIMPANLFGVIQ